MKDQSSKMAVLQKIIDMMDGLDAQKLGPKKPEAAIIDIHGMGGKAEGSPEEEKGESPAFEAKEDAASPDEDDDELMAKLHEMYSKVK